MKLLFVHYPSAGEASVCLVNEDLDQYAYCDSSICDDDCERLSEITDFSGFKLALDPFGKPCLASEDLDEDEYDEDTMSILDEIDIDDADFDGWA